MLRNLLLDWSGTLVDDLPPVIGATNFVLEKHGRPPLSREEFRRHFRLPFTEFYEEFLPDVPLVELDALFHSRFVEIQDEVAPLPGLYEFLDFCRDSGRRLFLLSSMKQEHFDVQSEKLGLRDYFEHPYAGVIDKRAKIGAVLETHGLERRETAFVGDMIHDIETARHGGVMSIAVLTGYDSLEKLTPARPDVVVSSLDALRRLLQDPWHTGGDRIRINALRVLARIGVPDEERAAPQKLSIDVVMESDFRGLDDDLARTTDYAAVAAWLKAECARREVKLLETLAEELAAGLLEGFPQIRAVDLEVRKFVLPDTRDVSVRVRRARP
ncbi:MAG: dihydroneopterin aldolase [Chthoniobacterales bacterium]|jgi:phosphoglycolate phosphatase